MEDKLKDIINQRNWETICRNESYIAFLEERLAAWGVPFDDYEDDETEETNIFS